MHPLVPGTQVAHLRVEQDVVVARDGPVGGAYHDFQGVDLGAQGVHERHDRSRVGKGFALSYLLRRIKREYDGYLVFDADNVVDRNYFREINKTFSAGYNIVRRETISYCPAAVFYDEQPTGFRQSVRQRMR